MLLAPAMLAPLTRLTHLELYFDDTETIASAIEQVGSRLETLHLLATNDDPDDYEGEEREPAELTTTQLNVIFRHCARLENLLLEVRVVSNAAAEVFIDGEEEEDNAEGDDEPGLRLLDLAGAPSTLKTIGTRYLMAVDHLNALEQLANPFSLPLLEAVPTFHLQPCRRAKVPWMHRQLRVPMFSADFLTKLLDRAVAGLRQRKNYREDAKELRRLYEMVEHYRKYQARSQRGASGQRAAGRIEWHDRRILEAASRIIAMSPTWWSGLLIPTKGRVRRASVSPVNLSVTVSSHTAVLQSAPKFQQKRQVSRRLLPLLHCQLALLTRSAGTR